MLDILEHTDGKLLEPEKVTTALVSQSQYQDVRDSYAVYFFKGAAEAPNLALCEAKDHVIDQRISLEMPETISAAQLLGG